MTCKFSIIIAAYNLGKLVCDAIESCIAQKGVEQEDFEIIVFDDGSSDNTLEYINKYRQIGNLRIVCQTNMGLSATRNRGIKIARGEYIMFLDGDDWLAVDALSNLIPYLDGESLIVFPMIYYYDESHKQIKSYGLEEKIYSYKEFLHKTLGHSQFHIIPSQNMCYKRDILIRNNVFFIEGILHEDNPFFIHSVYVFKKIKYAAIPIYYYRQNRQGSITSTCSIKNYRGIMTGNDEIVKITHYKNKDVNFLIANLYVFQVLGNYTQDIDRKYIYHYYRRFTVKLKLLYLLFNSTFRWKHIIRMILLIIDPKLLYFVIKRL